MKDGDAPAVVAKAIVAAAADKKPKLRYPAGLTGADSPPACLPYTRHR